jgi:hypothetical protein
MSWASPPKASPSVLRRRLQDDDSSSGAERVLAPPPHSATAIGHAPRESRSDGGLEDEGVASDGAEGSRGNGSRGAAGAGISGGLRGVYGARLLAARKPVLLCLVFAIGLGTVFNDKASTLLSKVHETPFWTRAGSVSGSVSLQTAPCIPCAPLLLGVQVPSFHSVVLLKCLRLGVSMYCRCARDMASILVVQEWRGLYVDLQYPVRSIYREWSV